LMCVYFDSPMRAMRPTEGRLLVLASTLVLEVVVVLVVVVVVVDGVAGVLQDAVLQGMS